MSTSSFDAEDIGLLVLGLFSAAVMVGIASVEAFGVSMSDTFTVSGYSASIAWIVAVGTFIGTIVTNDHTELLSTDAYDELMSSSMDDWYGWAILGVAALFLAWVFFPDVASFVKSQDLWGVLYVGLVATAQTALGWVY
jgi:hypothetical protein